MRAERRQKARWWGRCRGGGLFWRWTSGCRSWASLTSHKARLFWGWSLCSTLFGGQHPAPAEQPPQGHSVFHALNDTFQDANIKTVVSAVDLVGKEHTGSILGSRLGPSPGQEGTAGASVLSAGKSRRKVWFCYVGSMTATSLRRSIR